MRNDPRRALISYPLTFRKSTTLKKTKLKREGLYKSVDEIILTAKDSLDGWKFTDGWKYNETYIKTTAYAEFIRFEVTILKPGSIWFDDIKIEGTNDRSERTISQ